MVKTLNNPFFIEMQKGAEEAAERLGVSLVVQAADREVDVERQMQIIENLIERKVSALCITPSGSREIVPVIVKANKANIPVLIVDTRADEKALADAGGKIATFIGSDNYDGGKLAGAFVAEKLGGKGNVAVLEGIPGHETGDARLRGFREVVAKSPGIKIVASQPANWERDQGFNVFQNILQANPDINALFACSDLMALGATEAIAAAGQDRANRGRGIRCATRSAGCDQERHDGGDRGAVPLEDGRAAVENRRKAFARAKRFTRSRRWRSSW